MDTKVKVWLDSDRGTQHHAAAGQADDMTVTEFRGATDCGAEGVLHLVHHEHVDAGSLCAACIAVSGVRPPLEGQDLGPV